METLSDEVGKKMRSAVKAKLIEMGSGGSSGYIDDELPDYVMIMIANKRSKHQMNEDLTLFLGDNTPAFVDWLYLVLQKLQEVAIPTSTSSSTTAVGSTVADSSSSAAIASKSASSGKHHHSGKSSRRTAEPAGEAAPSITDVFAEHLMQRTQQRSSAADASRVKHEETVADRFDIASRAEVAATDAAPLSRRKELSTLADLQRKINQAKRVLKAECGGRSDDDDDDFINLNDDDQTGTDDGGNEATAGAAGPSAANASVTTARATQRVPITFGDDSPPAESATVRQRRDRSCPPKRSTASLNIADRLGTRPPASVVSVVASRVQLAPSAAASERRREAQPIYVPTYRRRDGGERNSDRDRNPDRDQRERERDRDRRERERERDLLRSRNPDRETLRDQRNADRSRERHPSHGHQSRGGRAEPPPKPGAVSAAVQLGDLRDRMRERRGTSASANAAIGSGTVITKSLIESATLDVPLNSVVKVKPRPQIPCKSLLLRAMAEAQKSTAAVKPRTLEAAKAICIDLLGGSPMQLYTKSIRNNHRKNLLIEVPGRARTPDAADEAAGRNSEAQAIDAVHDLEMGIDAPLKAGPATVDYQVIDGDAEAAARDAAIDARQRVNGQPSFVVTLGDEQHKRYEQRLRQRRLHEAGRARSPSVSPTIVACTPMTMNERAMALQQKVNVLIIKNDTDDEEELRREVERSKSTHHRATSTSGGRSAFGAADAIDDDMKTEEELLADERALELSRKRRQRSPITFGSNGNAADEDGKRVRNADGSPMCPYGGSDGERIEVVVGKFDHIPTLTTVSTSDAQQPTSTTSSLMGSSGSLSAAGLRGPMKERCKYFPNCGKRDACEFAHPTARPCKQFPNCKFGDMCLYAHPPCKFDQTCNRLGCNFSHSSNGSGSAAQSLSSHVVPVSNYKTVNGLCRFHPNCTNSLCTFYHPKACRFGRKCTNRTDCHYWHPDAAGSLGTGAVGGSAPAVPKDKLKWFASSTVY